MSPRAQSRERLTAEQRIAQLLAALDVGWRTPAALAREFGCSSELVRYYAKQSPLVEFARRVVAGRSTVVLRRVDRQAVAS